MVKVGRAQSTSMNGLTEGTRVEPVETELYQSTIEKNKVVNHDIVDVLDLANDASYMHPSSYEQVKKTPIVSTLPKGPIVDTMEVLMCGIIKRIDKWVEWTRERKKRMGSTSSTSGVPFGVA